MAMEAPKEISCADLKEFSRNCRLHKVVPMPKIREVAIWGAYVQDGERQFCQHEIALLIRFIKRMTGVHKKLAFPDRFNRDQPTVRYLWNWYIESRQTPAQASEKLCSEKRYLATRGATTLEAARKQLHEQLENDPVIIAQIQKKRKYIEGLKNFDYSKRRFRSRKVFKDGPMRRNRQGRIFETRIPLKSVTKIPQKRPHVADFEKMDDIPVSSQFVVKISRPKPIEKLLRRDQTLGKHMVKHGRESPLRQSVTLCEISDLEHDIENLNEQLKGEIENLKQQIAELEKKNFALRPRSKLLSIRYPTRIQLDGR
jgi:hypothetical protein